MKYHVWTEGCQMNVADSQRVSSALEGLGYTATDRAEDASVIVLNTCVVREAAENKAIGRLSSLAPLKKSNPDLVINLMGCMVGIRPPEKLQKRFPYVDVFSPPSDAGPLLAFLGQDEVHKTLIEGNLLRNAWMDEELPLPVAEHGNLVATHIPVVLGCSHACTYCIIPNRRGVERSRPAEDILKEARSLVHQGVKEITLLGQIVDRYGLDNPDSPNLRGLLTRLNAIEGLERIRFLTSHPNWMTDELLEAVASLDKVCPHIEVPIQAGDDEVLDNMKRGYTVEQYRRLVEKLRATIPGVSIATDIIVGFPGETAEKFQHTYDLLADLKLDVAHLARYSPREGTVSARRMPDDVPEAEKLHRLHQIDDLQGIIAAEIHARFLGETVSVLFEDKVKNRWRGRTPNNKLVFVESNDNLRGKVLPVQVTWTGPWSMQARINPG
jgi:tRNA-2-methylthio-N6-dimethylallyladenosine synthase